MRDQQLHRGGAKVGLAGQGGDADGGVQHARALAAHAHARTRLQHCACALQLPCQAT